MFDAPVDAWYVWVGLAVASLALFGTAGSLPSTAPPDAVATVPVRDRATVENYLRRLIRRESTPVL